MIPNPRISMWWLMREFAPCASTEFPFTHRINDVVGDKPVPALDKLKRALGLSDTGVARQQNPDSVDFDHYAVHRLLRSEDVREHAHEAHGEFGRLQIGKEHGALRLLGYPHEFAAHVPRREIVSENDAWNVEREHLVDGVGPALRLKFFEVGDLPKPEKLDAARLESVEKPCQCESRTVYVGNENLLGQPFPPTYTFEVQRVASGQFHI